MCKYRNTKVTSVVTLQTLDPVWNEQFEFTDFRMDEELVISIYDW